VDDVLTRAVASYVKDVADSVYPAPEHSHA
jgi:ketopantoate hydroxymethyltransferase